MKSKPHEPLTDAQRQLVEDHMYLIPQLLRKHDEDVQQYGYLMLVQCARKYDPANSSGASFKTYACWHIRYAPVEYYRECGRRFGESRRKRLRRQVKIVSLDYEYPGPYGSVTLVDLLFDRVDPNLNLVEIEDLVAAFFARYQSRKAFILIERFGLFREGKEQALKAIGETLGISESRVSQMQKEILQSAREYFASQCEPAELVG